MTDPAWDAIRARSEQTTPSGLRYHCYTCDFAYQIAQLPCREHATPDEHAQIDALLSRAMSNTALKAPRRR